MKVYILTMKGSAFMKTFKSFDDVLKEIEVINKDAYDGSHWSIFGRGYDQVWGDGDEIEYKEAETYNIDSAVLQEVVNHEYQYTTFFIRCIDGNTGEIIDLDTEN
tara:strand:- start:697 stop:1011 length:315 start_codon:yes stop_codon:yes gene_type:complete